MERLLPLQRARNFRDMGGYVAADGRRTKWRHLFRSGVMSYFTPEDVKSVEALSIGTVCDLRTADERRREPTAWGKMGVVHLSWDYDRRVISLGSLIEGPGLSGAQARNAMLKLYRLLPQTFAPQFRVVFAHLAASEMPLLFNCSAGKDRTGMLAALILTSLGVSHEQVIADYVLTDSVIDLENELLEHPEGSVGAGDEYKFLLRISSADRQPLFISSPDYIAAAFEQIDSQYGSFDQYLHGTLKLAPESLNAIRTRLLVP